MAGEAVCGLRVQFVQEQQAAERVAGFEAGGGPDIPIYLSQDC